MWGYNYVESELLCSHSCSISSMLRACLHQGVQEFQLCLAEQESPPEVHAGGPGRPSAKVTQYL